MNAVLTKLSLLNKNKKGAFIFEQCSALSSAAHIGQHEQIVLAHR